MKAASSTGVYTTPYNISHRRVCRAHRPLRRSSRMVSPKARENVPHAFTSRARYSQSAIHGSKCAECPVNEPEGGVNSSSYHQFLPTRCQGRSIR